MKIKLFIITLIFTVILSGCIAQQDLRPQVNDYEIWVCEEVENTYFYWDEEKDAFWGTITYKENSYNFVLGGGSGLVTDFYTPDVLQEDVPISDETTFLRGDSDYQGDKMIVEITEDKEGIFNGEVTTLTFVARDRKTYFESQNKTE